MSPPDALAALLAGNERFLSGDSHHEAHAHRLATLASGQNPWAIVLSCSDSRVSPEIVFDATLGDLFVVRVAGNFADAKGIGSMEYAVLQFATPIVFVLGHSGCGAIQATVENAQAGRPQAPGQIGVLIDALAPAVSVAQHRPGDLYANAAEENVRANVAKIEGSAAIVAPAVRDGNLLVVGGVYDTANGRILMVER